MKFYYRELRGGYTDNDGCFVNQGTLGPEYVAAPELLEALKAIKENWLRNGVTSTPSVGLIDLIYEAISKAEGEKA